MLCSMLLLVPQGHTKTFVHGTVWPVKERNMAEVLKERASLLNTKEIQDQWHDRARQYFDRPGSVALPRAVKSSIHEYAPIAHAYQDIRDNDGRLIAGAGTSINVLKNLPSYYPELYFFNADDVMQMDYIKRINVTSGTKFILVSGSISDVQRTLNQKVYFDQGGKLSKTFGIKQVPAHVYRKGDVLQVHEIEMKGASS